MRAGESLVGEFPAIALPGKCCPVFRHGQMIDQDEGKGQDFFPGVYYCFTGLERYGVDLTVLAL